MKQRLQNMNVGNKTVLVRVDYNVPVQGKLILDDTKIKGSLKTIEYLLDKNCKVVLFSHFGKVKSKEEKEQKNKKRKWKWKLTEVIDPTLTEEEISDLINKKLAFIIVELEHSAASYVDKNSALTCCNNSEGAI